MNVLIIGKAKTGTTILSKLIENAVDNTVYHMEPANANYFYKNDFAKGKNHIVKVIFEHWSKSPHLRMCLLRNELPLKFDKIVFIVRDPRDELISRLLYFIYPHMVNNKYNEAIFNKWKSVCQQKETQLGKFSFIQMMHEFNGIFNTQFDNQFKNGHHFLQFAAKQQELKQCYVIKYENLIDQKFEGIEKYLGFNLSPEVDQNSGALGRVSRSKGYGNWRNFFTPIDVRMLRHFLKPNKFYGFNDWQLNEKQIINPEECSLYLEKLKEAALTKDSKINKLKSWISKK